MKEYMEPELNILTFRVEDILTVSGSDVEDDAPSTGSNDLGWA